MPLSNTFRASPYVMLILADAMSVMLCVPLQAEEITTKPLVIKKGGTPEKQEVFDGNGMVIDLGIDITDHAWEKEGDVWTSATAIYGPNPVAEGQNAGLFLDETPIIIARDIKAERANPEQKGYRYFPPAALKPGQMGAYEDGRIYFRWPNTKQPATTRIIQLPKAGTSCVTIACSYVTVKNITARHASNDGFNIHNKWVGIRIENVKAFSNADEGISAHDDTQVDVDGAEVAWNGSSDGGVADVNQCTTTYKNCIVHDNVGAAFKLVGLKHSVSDTTIYNQKNDFVIGKDTKFQKSNITYK
jgi:hypothetical protein